ncbi:MAG: hypothetical protein AAF515_10465 [Pseudomonadota bacterium]
MLSGAQAVSTPSVVLAGNHSAEQVFSTLDAFLGPPAERAQSSLWIEAPVDPDDGMRVHLDLRRCTRAHQLADALGIVHFLAGRCARLDVSVATEQQAGFGEVLMVLGRTHGLAVSVS